MVGAACAPNLSEMDLYEADNRGSPVRPGITRCGSCPVKVSGCASYALKLHDRGEFIGGMIWGGVPVPGEKGDGGETDGYEAAVKRLRLMVNRDKAL